MAITLFVDHLLRQRAETENVRKQGQVLVEDAKKFGVQSLLKDLIRVIDTLDLVLTNVKKEQLPDDLKDFHTAIEMLEKDLHKTLGQHGVERFVPHGEDFNPTYHDALFAAPGDVPKNKILTVVKPGYMLHKRVVRAAHVGVSQGPPQKKD